MGNQHETEAGFGRLQGRRTAWNCDRWGPQGGRETDTWFGTYQEQWGTGLRAIALRCAGTLAIDSLFEPEKELDSDSFSSGFLSGMESAVARCGK